MTVATINPAEMGSEDLERRERSLDDTASLRRRDDDRGEREPPPERGKAWLQQWLSPGVILGVVGWIFLVGVGSNRLANMEASIAELKSAVAASTAANQNATVELVRTQERLASANSRLAVLEEKMANQEQINVRVFSGLAKLGG